MMRDVICPFRDMTVWILGEIRNFGIHEESRVVCGIGPMNPVYYVILVD